MVGLLASTIFATSSAVRTISSVCEQSSVHTGEVKSMLRAPVSICRTFSTPRRSKIEDDPQSLLADL